MNMEGEQRIAASPQKVWEALNDPEVLRASIPGCQTLAKEADDRFTATVEVKVGPIGARFKGAVGLTDLNPPNSYTLNLEGNGGISGSVSGTAKVRLQEADDGTLLRYEVDARVGGRMAQLGGPIIDATAKQLAGKFFNRFGEIVSGVKAAEPAAAAVASRPAMQPSASAPSRPAGLPVAWILALIIAAGVGFLFGSTPAAVDSAWAGVAIGLLLVIVAATAFEYGRRTAQPTIVLDSNLLRRLTEGEGR